MRTDAFEIEFPAKYEIPVIDNSELYTNDDGDEQYSIIPSGIVDSLFQADLDITIREDTASGNTIVRFGTLRKLSRTSEAKNFAFEFRLQAPSIGVSILLEDIECRIMLGDDTLGETTIEDSSGETVEIGAVQGGQITVSADGSTAGDENKTLLLTYQIMNDWQSENFLYIQLPKANAIYDTGQNAGQAIAFVSTATKNDPTIVIDGNTMTISNSWLNTGSDYEPDQLLFQFDNVPTADAGSDLQVSIDITMPTVISEVIQDFDLKILNANGASITAYDDDDLLQIEGASPPDPDTTEQDESNPDSLYATGGISTTQVPTTSTGNSITILDNKDGVAVEDVSYQFEIRNTLSLPSETVIVITVPDGVVIPDNDAGNLAITCDAGCTQAGTMDYSGDELTITDAILNGWVQGPDVIKFTISGWTNPADTFEKEFEINTSFKDPDDDTLYGIEKFTGMSVRATEGICTVQDRYVTDEDTRIYAQPESYTFQVWCSHAIEPGYRMIVTFPEEFILVETQGCTFTAETSESGVIDERAYCKQYPEDNYIEIRDFNLVTIPEKEIITFTVNQIINPGTFGATGVGTIQTQDYTGAKLDEGDWQFPQRYFTVGTIETFRVFADQTGVGKFPVNYTFNIIPNGDVWQKSKIILTFPSDEFITSRDDIVSSCGTDLQDFTNDQGISCAVPDDRLSITIRDGFLYQASTNITDDDGIYSPPNIQFTIGGFTNPREGGIYGPFGAKIIDFWDDTIYEWDTEETTPTIRISGVSQSKKFEVTQSNKINGELSDVDFDVISSGGLSTDDKIIVKLPFGWQWTEETEVFGTSGNLDNVMTNSLSDGNRQIDVNVEVFVRGRRLEEEDTQVATLMTNGRMMQSLRAGIGFTFRITNMKNYHSFKPAEKSIEYYVYSSTGNLFEEYVDGIFLQNDTPGQLDALQNGILPGDFRTDFEANYTLTVNLNNFEKNMRIIMSLPEQISFGDEDPECTGLSGTSNAELICRADRTEKTLTFTNAVQFYDANPGQMRILLKYLKNPVDNIITDSFLIRTETFDGYQMDEISSGITINFYCEYPCAQCPQGQPDFCLECYQTAVERYFHENKCLAECPEKMVETELLTCEDCQSPCVTCEGSPTFCTLCIDGYYVIEGGKCRESIVWYFPFLGTAAFFLLLITISEVVTKRKSNFKESLIAFWSIPEVLSWGCLIWFMWYRVGEERRTYATGLAAIAAILYLCINFVHAIIHPRYMVPTTLYSYKQLITDYKCGTFIARAISYIISYKFSLILVSYFFNSPRLMGDYSAMNWKQFNRFSLVFIVFPYSCMMGSCIWFILTDGLYSYPGFVAVEVMTLSSIIAILLAIDAISAIKCKTVGKRKTNKAIKVATGADYESDEDEVNLKKKVLKSNKVTIGRGKDDFGLESEYDSEQDSVTELKQANKLNRTPGRRLDSENSYRSQLSQQTQMMNEEARKQIAMLEELAHQMREEKRQLQLDKDRIEREKMGLENEKARSVHNMEAYMDDYARQTTALSNKVRDMEREKLDLVASVEQRLEEGNRQTNMLAQRVKEANEQKQMLATQQIRKNFRDFEGEMEDYEPVEEENSEDAESSIAEVVDSAQLPVKPACGQIDYYRHMEGEAQHWMQQITPRAGGDSMLGQHDMEDDTELAMQKNDTAHYEIASVPPSRHDEMNQPGAVEAEFQEMNSQLECAKSEEFQQRSDAEMEINSEMEEKDAVEQQFFEPERAIFSQLQDRDEVDTQAEFFSNVTDPVFEHVEKPPTRHGVEQRHFVAIEANKGKADPTDELRGSTQHFFKQEPPTYGQMLEEGEMERQATAQHFFNPERATQGEADDAARSGLATPQEFIQRTAHVYGNDIEDPNQKELGEIRAFNPEAAIKDDVSNLGRSVVGSELIYQEREAAMMDKNLNDDRVREGTEQQFFNREDAMYSQDKSMADKNATTSEFFKHDEAVRGDITSGDRSVAATQQNYFANVDHPELGRPDSYSRFKSDIAQEYMNKSDLGGLSDNLRAQGAATPHDDRQADPIDYMNKSEAEYGRQSTVHEQDATQTKFFEQEKNPEFGRGEQFTRNREMDQEYNPTPVEDSSGRSESSEGGMAEMQPFNSNVVAGPRGNDPNVEQVKKVLHQNPNAKRFEEDQRMLAQEAPDAALMPSPQKGRGASMKQAPGAQQVQRQPKTILYSDKSETSVEDLMDDTPSNYNIQNGRFEGKSLGLKALLLHAKNYINQTVDDATRLQNSKTDLLQGMASLAEQQNRSPQHARPGNQIISPGFLGAQKGIIGSQNDERQFINNLYQTNQSMGANSSANQWRANGPVNANRVPVIGEESSTNGDGVQPRNTRNQVRTNKQFQEDPTRAAAGRGRGARGPPPNMAGARSPNMQNAAAGRGAPKITKNNYFGGGST